MQSVHGVWACENFKKMTVPKRWEVATEHTLCFCCLADGRRGERCFRSRVCGLSGCISAHHRMLHQDEPGDKTSHNERSDLTSGPAGGTTEEGEPSERTHMKNHYNETHCSF